MSIENLVMKHAKYSDRKRELKKLGEQESERCTSLNRQEIPGVEGLFETFGKSCITKAYEGHQDAVAEVSEFGGFIHFDETWQDCLAEEEICEHCIAVRELKRERMKVSSKLGQIRGVITRVGRRMNGK